MDRRLRLGSLISTVLGLSLNCSGAFWVMLRISLLIRSKASARTYLDPGDGVPSLLLEQDWWLILLDNGRSFSDSIRGLDGATLELRPSSSSRSASPVIFGEDESRLSPSCCDEIINFIISDIKRVFSRLTLSSPLWSLPSRFLWSSFKRSDFLHLARRFCNEII